MDAFEVLTAIASVFVFSVPFAFFAYVRYLRYKETIALAEKGLLRPSRSRNGRDTQRWGIVITFLGVGFTLGLLTLGWGPWLIPGFLATFFGSSLLAVHRLNKGDEIYHLEDEIRLMEGGNDEDAVPPHKG